MIFLQSIDLISIWSNSLNVKFFSSWRNVFFLYASVYLSSSKVLRHWRSNKVCTLSRLTYSKISSKLSVHDEPIYEFKEILLFFDNVLKSFCWVYDINRHLYFVKMSLYSKTSCVIVGNKKSLYFIFYRSMSHCIQFLDWDVMNLKFLKSILSYLNFVNEIFSLSFKIVKLFESPIVSWLIKFFNDFIVF